MVIEIRVGSTGRAKLIRKCKKGSKIINANWKPAYILSNFVSHDEVQVDKQIIDRLHGASSNSNC